MNIVILGLNYAPESVGIGRYTSALAQGLAARGARVTVLAGRPYYPEWRSLDTRSALSRYARRERGVAVLRVPHFVPRRPNLLGRLAHHVSFALSAGLAVPRLIKRGRPDVVIAIAPALMSAPVALHLARAAKAATLLHLQDFERDMARTNSGSPLVRAAHALSGKLETALLRRFHAVSTISEPMRARLVEKGVRATQTHIIPNGIPVARFAEPAGKQPQSDTDTIVALYSGTLNAKQDLGVICEAARRLSTRRDIHFIVCGNGPEAARVGAAARTLPNLSHHPLVSDAELPALLAQADIHLLSQRAGAADLVLPSKLGPMLASGRPIVATAQPGSAIANEIRDCGIAVAHGDAHAFADAVVALAGSAERRAVLGTAARERAAEAWEQSVSLDRMGALVESLARAPDPTPGER